MASTESCIMVGSRVLVFHSIGTVRFIGETQFANGEWIGVQLDIPVGNCNGTVDFCEYFLCNAKHGVFVRRHQVRSILTSVDINTPIKRLLANASLPGTADRFGPATSPAQARQECSGVFTEREIDRIEGLNGDPATDRLWVMGENHLGQLGLGHQRSNVLVPALLHVFSVYEDVQMRRVLSVVFGGCQTIALVSHEKGASRILVGGSSSLGAGIPFEERDHLRFKGVTAVDFTQDVIVAVAASATLCAVALDDARIRTWGSFAREINAFRGIGRIASLACTSDNALVVCLDTGKVYVVDALSTPIAVDFGNSAIVAIACAADCHIALTSVGSVHRWSRTGAIGIIPFPDDVTIVEIACGDSHFMARSSSGDLFAWGSGRYGALGTGSLEDQPQPTLIQFLTGAVVQVACGARHTICLTSHGRVCTWGDGSLGQLGHGDTTNFAIPHSVISLEGKGIIQVAAGAAQSLACTRLFSDPLAVTSSIRSCVEVAAAPPVVPPTLFDLLDEPPSAIFDEVISGKDDLIGRPAQRTSEVRKYTYNDTILELDIITSDMVELVHRCIHFQIEEDVHYRGALNCYIRKCYDDSREAYVFKHLTTSIALNDPPDPQESRMINATLLLICRARPPAMPSASNDVQTHPDAAPDWMSLFIDAFHPLEVNPRFVQLAPSINLTQYC